MKSEIITKEWMKGNSACLGSYAWLEKQENKECKSIAKKLYLEKRYDWCFWLLYRKTITAKLIVWIMIILSYLCSGISIYLSINYNNNAIAGVFAGAFAVTGAFAIAGVFAGIFAVAGTDTLALALALAFAGTVAVVGAFTVLGAVAFTVVGIFAIAGAVALAFAGAGAGADITMKIICQICLK